MTQRGRVLRDNQRRSWSAERGWQAIQLHSGTHVAVGAAASSRIIVDVSFNTQGAPETVRVVPEGQVAKEQAAASLVEAQKKSGELAASVLARFGKITLVAELFLVLGWFFILSHIQERLPQ
jgi:hypothetical protein